MSANLGHWTRTPGLVDRADLFGARRAGTSKSQLSVRSRLSETNDLWETRYGLLGCLSYGGNTVYVRSAVQRVVSDYPVLRVHGVVTVVPKELIHALIP